MLRQQLKSFLTADSGVWLVADPLTELMRRLAALSRRFVLGALQASVIVRLTAVPAIALGGRLRQRQSAGQQQSSSQKKKTFFQWFLPWARMVATLTTIGLRDQFVHSNPVNCRFSVAIAHKYHKLAVGGKDRGHLGRVAGTVLCHGQLTARRPDQQE